MKFVVVLGLLAFSAIASPECDAFKAKLSETAASHLYYNCLSDLNAWFCPCLVVTAVSTSTGIQIFQR